MPAKKAKKKTEKQRKIFGAALGANRQGKSKPSYVTKSIWNMKASDLSVDASKPKRKKKKVGG